MITPGTYPATVVRQYFGTSEKKKTPFVCVVLQVKGPVVEEHEYRIYLSPAAMKRAAFALGEFDVDVNDKEQLMALYENPEALAGREVFAEIAEEDYNDNTYIKVVNVSKTQGSGGELDRDQFINKIMPRLQSALKGGKKKEQPKEEDDSGADYPF